MKRNKTLMENFRIIRSSNKDVAVAVAGSGRRRRSNPNDQACCKNHPKHRQPPGVCSLCLKEKLSRLSANSSSRSITIASSCSSSYCSSSSAASSYSSSPMHRYRGKDGFSMFLVGGGGKMLAKSRSVSFVSRFGTKEGKKNKTGFLSKLLHPKRVH